jgi:hypothetical protein
MTLAWDALPGMARYAVYRGLHNDANEWSLLDANVASTSYTDNAVSQLSEYHYRVIGFAAEGAASLKAETFGASAAMAPVSSPWVSQDVGGVGGPGAAGMIGSAFQIVGGGADVWGSSDEFHYVSTPMSGDGAIAVRVASMENPAPSFYSRAGIMMRETSAVGSKYASLMLHPSEGGVRLQSRASTNGSTAEINGAIVNAPYWLRLTRTGNLFTGEISDDGASWSTVGSVSVSMGAAVRIGMAVTARNDAYMHWGVFDNVTTTANSSITAINAGDQNAADRGLAYTAEVEELMEGFGKSQPLGRAGFQAMSAPRTGAQRAYLQDTPAKIMNRVDRSAQFDTPLFSPITSRQLTASPSIRMTARPNDAPTPTFTKDEPMSCRRFESVISDWLFEEDDEDEVVWKSSCNNCTSPQAAVDQSFDDLGVKS